MRKPSPVLLSRDVRFAFYKTLAVHHVIYRFRKYAFFRAYFWRVALFLGYIKERVTEKALNVRRNRFQGCSNAYNTFRGHTNICDSLGCALDTRLQKAQTNNSWQLQESQEFVRTVFK